jgi:uncharacterized DUF497 family protein
MGSSQSPSESPEASRVVRRSSNRDQNSLRVRHSYGDETLSLVAHTERGDNIRIISARKATQRERKVYEENNEQTQS